MNTETQEILNDPDAMAAIGQAENEMVLQSFTVGIMNLAIEAEVWGNGEGVGISPAVLFERVGELMEQALKDRAMIRQKYKVSLL